MNWPIAVVTSIAILCATLLIDGALKALTSYFEYKKLLIENCCKKKK